MLHAIVPLVGEFRALYPLITLELNTDDLHIDLLAQRTDIAIRIGELRDSTLHARLLCHSLLRVLASPPTCRPMAPWRAWPRWRATSASATARCRA